MRYILLGLVIMNSSFAQVDVKKVLTKMDRLYRSKTSHSVMMMSVIHPEWHRQMKLKAITQGLEKSFITILSPAKDKGISTLKIDNEMWNYFPKINKVIKVPPSMMMGSWMGSDFTNDDLVKENTYLDDHFYKLITDNDKIYEIELTPKRETVSVWGKVILTIEKKRLIPLKESFFDEKNQLVRQLTFDKVKKVGSKEIPFRLTLIPVKKKGQKTVVEYLEISFDQKIAPGTFSRNNLQKRR